MYFLIFLLIQISLKAVKVLIMLHEGNQRTLSVITVEMVSHNSSRASLASPIRASNPVAGLSCCRRCSYQLPDSYRCNCILTDLERIVVIISLPPNPTQSIFSMHKKLLNLLDAYIIFLFYMLTNFLDSKSYFLHKIQLNSSCAYT